MSAFTSQRSGNWSRTSDNADSPWYDGGAQTALARVPGSTGTDTATVAAGHTVTYDYDMSAAGVMTGIVLDGTLVASTSPGSYYLKMGGTAGQNITYGANGSLQAGSSGTAYPANCTFTIDLNGSSGIDLASGPSGCLALYCTEPTWPIVRIGAEAAGQTQLDITGWVKPDGTVETGKDLTTDASWAATRGVRVDDVNGQDTEARTISTIGSNYVTVSAGITNAKIANALVLLTWRNVRIIGYNTTAGAVQNGTGAVLGCEIALGSSGYGTSAGTGYSMTRGCIHGGSRGWYYGTGHTMSGGTISGCTSGWYYGTGHTMSGGTISGCSDGWYAGTGHTMSGGTISGCWGGWVTGTGHTMSGGTISGCTQGWYYGTGHTMSGGTITGCFVGRYGGAGHTMSGGTITGCFVGWHSGIAHTMSGGTISGCTEGWYGGSGHTMSGGTISGCTRNIRTGPHVLHGGSLSGATADLYGSSGEMTLVRGYGTTLASATQYTGYRACPDTHGINRAVIWDIGGVDGAVKWWAYGGHGESVATQPTNWPSGVTFSESYQQTFETADVPCYLDKPIYGRKGVPIRVDVYCKMSATGFTTLGTAELVDPSDGEPIASSPLATATMEDNTDWQKLTLEYTPTYDHEITMRVRAKNASGTLIWRDVVTLGGGGGAPRIGSNLIMGVV